MTWITFLQRQHFFIFLQLNFGDRASEAITKTLEFFDARIRVWYNEEKLREEKR